MNPGSKVASIEQLTEISVLKDLSIADLTALQPHTVVQLYQKEDVVMHEGDRLPLRLYILLQGQLQLTRIGTAGKETWLRTLLPGEIFAAPALIGNGIAPATVTAILPSQIMTIEREALFEQIRNTPEIAFKLLEVYNQRLQQMHQTIHDLISEKAIVRLVRLLQYQAAQHGTIDSGTGNQLQIQMSHYQIARSIGISYEECARLFSQLKGTVSYQRGGKITILDWHALNGIAEG